jgi:hypothetical protein
VFSTWFVPRSYLEENLSCQLIESSLREGEKRWRYCSVVRYSPDSNDVSTEAEESPLLTAVTKQRLVKTLQAGGGLACGD